MDAAQTVYATFVLTILVALVVTVTLFLIGYRIKKERVFMGYTGPKEEAYAGYTLLAVGVTLIVVSVYETVSLLTGPISAAPFALMNIVVTGGNTIPGELIGLGFGIAFWMIILWLGGRRLTSVGLDLLKGKKIILKIKS